MVMTTMNGGDDPDDSIAAAAAVIAVSFDGTWIVVKLPVLRFFPS